MVLGIAEDYSIDVALDSELTAIPQSGIYLNSGVHPSITVNNILQFLPFPELNFTNWSNTTTYGKYSQTRKKSDIVTSANKIYQSLVNNNLNHAVALTDYWLETNNESLKLKSHIQKVKDRVYNELGLTKRLIENQFIYSVGDNAITLPNDYASFTFESKGSDYVTIRLNQVSIQKSGTTPINLYVVNQGVLVDTLEITPSNGRVDFKDLNYTFKGFGKWQFIIDSTDVITSNATVEPFLYDGFVCYMETGTGNSPETATYSKHTTNIGIGFNVTAYLDATTYIDNNINELASYVRATFELMTLEMFLYNSENRSNRSQLSQLDKQALFTETKSFDGNTVASKHRIELSRAKKLIEKTFDTQLSNDDNDNIFEVKSI